MRPRSIGILFISIFLCLHVAGQNLLLQNQKDSGIVFKKIERFSNQRKITRLIYPLFFIPTETILARISGEPEKPENKLLYRGYEGKIIRSITIQSIDPFGFRVNDTARKPVNFRAKVGNDLHIKSLPITIRNFLLFKKNEPFDSLLVAESERLLRKQRFVREVKIEPLLLSGDSVDVLIRVQDVWSIVPDGSLSGNNLTLRLKEQNFLGTGHQFSLEQTRNVLTGRNAFDAGYEIPNIDNSYVTATLRYTQADDRSYLKRLSVDRAFYSAYSRWAGGILIEQQVRKDSLVLPNSFRVLQNSKLNTHDYWLGSAWQLFRGRSEIERNTNLILTSRWKRIRYLEKPPEIYDTLNSYSNESFYMAGLGLNSRKYVQDKFLFRFGVTEDIPIGRSYNIYSGYRERGENRDWYLGAKTSWADFYRWGYFASKLEYGTFFNKTGIGQGVFQASFTYFTNLFELSRWRFRQFVRTDLIWGMNRLPSDKLIFNNYMDSGGFDGQMPPGTGKFRIALQTQSYAPWNLLGFRLGPFMVCTVGKMGNETTGFSKSKFYSYIGMGVLIRNDFLNSNYFQLSLSFYPAIPETGNNVLKSNSLQTSDFGLQDFESGKPDVVIYR